MTATPLPVSSFTTVAIPITDLPPNHVLHFYVSLLTPMSLTWENTPFKREVSCKLQYLKVPDGKYEVEVTEELKFQPPFEVGASLYPGASQSEFMLLFECKNLLWTSVSVLGYNLSLADGITILGDPNKIVTLRHYVRAHKLLYLIGPTCRSSLRGRHCGCALPSASRALSRTFPEASPSTTAPQWPIAASLSTFP